MKNSTIFPFERNRYFYGKLLSVEDFELEQKYYNDKRRMINHFVCGTGVVAGMHVVMVDERTISVESGCALDTWGREIVLDAPVVRKLSLLDGFENCEDMRDGCVYLCVEYDEKETSPVHNIAGNAGISAEGSVQNSRIREGCRLYLTNQRPEEINLSWESLSQESQEIYGGEGISIVETCPRYARSGDDVELVIRVENLNSHYISFSCTLDLARLTWEGKPQLEISFDEMMYEKTGSYTLVYHLKAAEAADVEAGFQIAADSFRLYAARKAVNVAPKPVKAVLGLTGQEVSQEIIRQYYRNAMENQTKNAGREAIYLGKIYMVRTGDSYMIDRVENIPYGQYVASNYLNAALIQMLIREGVPGRTPCGELSGTQSHRREESSLMGIQLRSGVEEFDLSRGGQKGARLNSGEIFHGLGFGRVTIQVGIEEEEGSVIYGSAEVFSPQKYRVETAVKTYEDRGSFVIGLRLLETIVEGKIRVHWTAVKDVGEERKDKVEKKIFIKPGLLELGLRENCFLETNGVNMADKRIIWSVKEGGGFIDAVGNYTAPNTPGVYEITAKSAAYPEVKASVFAVIRDRGKE